MNPSLGRRELVCCGLAASVLLAGPHMVHAQPASAAVGASDKRRYDAAAAIKCLAEVWGDQSYGAVLVLDDRLVGEGPSRVVQLRDPSAHAEHEAIRNAQRRLGRICFDGSVLYSTSHPCAVCQAAAAAAGVRRRVVGEGLRDAVRQKQIGRASCRERVCT